MRISYKYVSRNSAYFVCALAAAALVLSGCGKPESRAAARHAGKGMHPEAALGSTAHTHSNPGETCFICDPSKRDKGRLWCKEHGRYEDRCWLCHSELEDKTRLFCKEHALYEDECFLCHPELKADGGSASADRATPLADVASAAELQCNEHGVPEIECGICHPDRAALLESGDNLKIRFPSTEAAGKVGIRTAHPRASETTLSVKAFCETQYNLNTLAKVTPLVGGVIREVRFDIGEPVKAGETLVILHSADVASTKSDYLSAFVERDIRRKTFEREQRLNEQQFSAESEFLDAEAVYRTADLTLSNLKQKLLNLGLTEDEIAVVKNKQDASADISIRAPFDGTLIARAAVVGEAVEIGHALFTIADLSTHWLALSVPSDHIAQVRVGQGVTARFQEFPDATYTGSITWVDASVDPRTRMVRARALMAAPIGRMKAGLFGEARVHVGETRSATLVPREAVQRHEGNPFVFVQNAPDLFSLRRIDLGESSGQDLYVLAGLQRDDAVVTEGSFIVMSEFLKSRLGAGCVDE